MGKKKRWMAAVLCLAMLVTAAVPSTVNAATEKFTEKKVVVLDPGHGGYDSGAVEVHNGQQYIEAEINWKIARYTMQELQKYPNIEVHMTRNNQNQFVGLVDRVLIAKSYQADLLVSQHINSADTPYAKGASVLVSSGTYRPYLAETEKLFGRYVIDELGKLGISKRFSAQGGMEYRLSSDGSVYPNGARRDYYAIVAQSVQQDLPGVIIEHAFVSSPSDAYNFFRTNSQLKKLGQADARAIVRYFNRIRSQEQSKDTSDTVTSNQKNGWKKAGRNMRYYINGVRQKNRVLHLKDGTYYVDKNGNRAYGWKTINGNCYFFDKRNDGKASVGWLTRPSGVFCFNANGIRYENTQLISTSGKIYIIGSDGKRCSGWTNYRGERYYINNRGYAHTGWLRRGGKWYCFDKKKGAMYRNRTVKMDPGQINYKFDRRGVCTNRK